MRFTHYIVIHYPLQSTPLTAPKKKPKKQNKTIYLLVYQTNHESVWS